MLPLLLLAQMGVAQVSQPAVHTPTLAFQEHVVDNLSLFYLAFAPAEFIVCLEITSVDNRPVVTDWRMPHYEPVKIELAGGQVQNGIKFVKGGDCGQRYGLHATLHSHPADKHDDFCYLSRTDTQTAERMGLELAAIICRKGIYFWWAHQLHGGDLAYPKPGQYIAFSTRWPRGN